MVGTFELQASRDPALSRRLLKYNVLLHDRHDVPVHSVVVLLRPEADSPDLTGDYYYRPPQGPGRVEFGYQVLRIWQKPVEAFLEGGLGTLPLAPLSAVSVEVLPAVITRMQERLRSEVVTAQAATLWTATYILMGLRYPSEFTGRLLQRVLAMEESATYQAIITRGKLQEAQKLLLQLGTKRFGPPSAATRAAIEAITEVERLEQLTERLLDASSWDQLLATP